MACVLSSETLSYLSTMSKETPMGARPRAKRAAVKSAPKRRTVAESIKAIDAAEIPAPRPTRTKRAAAKSAPGKRAAAKSAPVKRAAQKSGGRSASKSAPAKAKKIPWSIIYDCLSAGVYGLVVEISKRRGVSVRRSREGAAIDFKCAAGCADKRHTITIPFNSTTLS
jgi:hypothetical protein